MTTVMVTSAGRRRYVLEELVRFAGPGDTVIAADMNPLAPALSTPGVQAMAIHGDSPEQRAREVLANVESSKVDALLSLHDYEAIELSQHTKELSALGCLFIGPSVEACQVSLDKLSLAELLNSIDPKLTPQTYSQIEQAEQAANTSARWILKDRLGSASSGLQFVDAAALVSAAKQLPLGTWVAQPFSAGIEYNVDIFRDLDGSIAGTSTKQKWAMRGGETDSATVLLNPPEPVVDAALRATAELDITGNVDVDVILDTENNAVVIDINPRFGGGYAFSALAGYRAGQAIWQLARREDVTPLSPDREITAAKHVAVAEVRGHE